jgi:hypothetical protein
LLRTSYRLPQLDHTDFSAQKHNPVRTNQPAALPLLLFFLLPMAAAAAFFCALLFISVQHGVLGGYTRNDFPADFVFGAATSAYQVTAMILSQLNFCFARLVFCEL